jgi:hypothetical protein
LVPEQEQIGGRETGTGLSGRLTFLFSCLNRLLRTRFSEDFLTCGGHHSHDKEVQKGKERVEKGVANRDIDLNLHSSPPD